MDTFEVQLNMPNEMSDCKNPTKRKRKKGEEIRKLIYLKLIKNNSDETINDENNYIQMFYK